MLNSDKHSGVRKRVHILRIIADMDTDLLQRAIATELGIKWRVSDGNMDFICGRRTNREHVEAGTLIGTFPFSNAVCHGEREDTFPDWCGSLDEMYNLVEGLDAAGKTKFIHCLCYLFLREKQLIGSGEFDDKLLLYMAQAIALDRAKAWLMVKYIVKAESPVEGDSSGK